MRVLILSQYFWPENFRVNDAARELKARGHDVTVLTGVPNYPGGKVFDEYQEHPERYSALNGIEIVRVPLFPRGRNRFSLTLNYLSFAITAASIGWFKLRHQHFDVILAFQFSPATIGLPAVVLRSLMHAPLVLWVQDLWPESLVASGVRSPLILGWTSWFVRWVYRHCDHLLGQSHAFVTHLRGLSPDAVPVSYLPNWSATASTAQRSTVGGKSTFDIYFLGNLGLAQDLPAVMGAVARLADHREIHWHFVGDGRMSGWLREQITSRNAEANVHLHAPVPPEGLQPFLDDADALLVCLKPDPLFAMTVPSKVQSYLDSGLPIVAMLDGEGARILTESGAGLVVPAGDAGGLASLILRLAAMSPSDRLAMGSAGKRYGVAHFGLHGLVGRLEEILAHPRYPAQSGAGQ